jgi:hypothetical protein
MKTFTKYQVVINDNENIFCIKSDNVTIKFGRII